MNNKEFHTVPSETEKELAIQEARARKLAIEKSYLELIIQMMSRMSYSSGVNDIIEKLMINIMDVIGGTNIIIVYLADNELFYADVYGTNMKIDDIDDPLIKQVFESHNPIEWEHDFLATQMLTSEFTKASTWAYPLLVGSEIVGVIKMENMHIGMKELNRQLPIFFNYTAHILKNNIQNTSRLKQAYDQLSKSNSDLTREIYERKLAEKELVKAKEELEMRVTERTAELRKANEKLQEELIMRRKVEKELKKYREHLEDLVTTRTCELEKAREIAESASKAKSIFLASMSHELRTPLNAILGYTQLFGQDTFLPKYYKRGINIIEKNGKHLLRLINDILDIAKIESGKFELERYTFSLKNLLNFIYEMINIETNKKELSFFINYSCDLPLFILGDEKKLSQVLINLLGNAVKFTQHGSVTFKVEKHNGKIRFSVEDTGPGIPEEKLEDIFSPFKQLSDHFRKTEGTGLGLAISQNLVRLMGGTLKVESIYGKGSKFWFEIDLKELPSCQNHQLKGEQIITGYKGDRRKILIVDDKIDNRLVMTDILKNTGFEVKEAENGIKCLEKLDEFKPDLIFMDLVMPEMDGYEATGKIRENPLYKGIKIIAISAGTPDEHDNNILRSRFDGYLTKPLLYNDLSGILTEHLQLEWIYKEKILSPLTGKEMEEKVLLPHKDIIEHLYKLSEEGNLKAVKKELKKIKESGENYSDFYNQIMNLADSFEIDNIINILKKYLEEGQ